MYQIRVKLTILTQNDGIFLPLFQMGWVKNTLDFPTIEPVTVADNTKYKHDMQSQES